MSPLPLIGLLLLSTNLPSEALQYTQEPSSIVTLIL